MFFIIIITLPMASKTVLIGDNADLIRDVASNTIQLIYFNPPFGTTKKEWDTPLDWDTLFPEMWRVLKPNGAIIIHASIPFTWTLVRQSWAKDLKYQYYWNKLRSTNFLNSSYAPLRRVEDILVYYKHKPKFNYIVPADYRGHCTDEVVNVTGYYGNKTKCTTDGEKLPMRRFRNPGGKKKNTPTDYIEIARTAGDFTRPDDLMRFIVSTYTDESDTVLDITCGDARCGTICQELGRNFLGFDKRDLIDPRV